MAAAPPPWAVLSTLNSQLSPHPPTPDAKGAVTVFIGGKPAARMGDMAACSAPIVMGMPTVVIGG